MPALGSSNVFSGLERAGSGTGIAWICIVLLVAGGSPLPAQQDARALSPSDIAELYSDSIVQILVETGDTGVKQGTGFPLAEDGVFATSLHLMDGATQVWIRSAAGEKWELESIQAYDVSHDLVVLRVGTQGLSVPPLGDSSGMEIGDPVVVIGNPLGLTRTVTDGILSARRRPGDSNEDDPFASELLGVPDCELLQISAPVAPGTSGAPVFDLTGHVVAIEMGGLSAGALDLNFAVPVEGLKPLEETYQGLDLESLQWIIDEERHDAAAEYLENARLALELNDPVTADTELNKALARFPRFAEALLLKSQLLIAQEEPDLAEELLLEATKLAPYSTEIWQALGDLYLDNDINGSRRLNRARTCFEKVLELEPGHSGAAFGLGALLLSESRVDEAIDMLESAFRDDPTLTMAGFVLGQAYVERERFSDAADIFDDVLWEDPEFAPAHFGRAWVAYFLDEIGEERTHWERFFELVEGDERYGAMLEEALRFLRAVRPDLLPWRYR